MLALDLLALIGGFVVLSVGGECLVHGASRLARSLGISALLVGLTVVAFGTSAPEIAVSVSAGIRDHDDLAIGNVVGSCLVNILVVLGITALVRPLKVSRNIITTDAPIMILGLAVFMLFAIDDGQIHRWQGLVFLAGMAGYVVFTIRQARRQAPVVAQAYEAGIAIAHSRVRSVLLIVAGLAGLVGGAEMIVHGATALAQAMGISEHIIALTIVAIGTSLPEVATCVVAARRNQPDIAIGNIVGSNIFNILAVIGVASSVAPPLEVHHDMLYWHAPAMMIFGALSLPLMRTGHSISRREGVV
ncbi:MAG: calcium/sodium antiporter, partial [Planctomycetes bacterium]|nr:calcium/sodium antiporter [Planctomycetota bacterium]